MPITLPPISRRGFLAGSLGAGAGLMAGGRLLAAETKADPNRFALLADTHISGKREEVVRGTNMFANLRQVGGELASLQRRPSSVMINGDCAYLTGKEEDYSALVELLKPIRESGLPVHLTMGNHDHRQRFWNAVPPAQEQNKVVVDRHITVFETPQANFFLLDSLGVTNVVTGILGQRQLQWLAKSLDARPNKAALVYLHHNPDPKEKPTGLSETKELLEMLAARKQVKAYFFGHTHSWSQTQHKGIHLVNLPPVAYVFNKESPNGWVDMQVGETGAVLELHTIDPKHPQNGEKVNLAWRT